MSPAPALKRHWPLAMALLLLAVVATLALRGCLSGTGGRFVYALDDPYIYMAIAKNLVTHRTWGTTPHGFTSAASSPAWLLLLTACYALFGVNELAPLVLNLGFAALLVVMCSRVLRRFELDSAAVAALLAAVVLLTPIVPVALCGLEHFAHAAASVAFLALAGAAGPDLRARRHQAQLATLAALVVAARYEGLFLVGAVVGLLLLRRRWAPALVLTAAALVPVVAYGVFSLGHGWAFLPNSVILKARSAVDGPSLLSERLGQPLVALADGPHLLAMLLGGAAMLAFVRRQAGHWRDPPARMMLLTLIATILHLLLARTGWFYRYEAYLVSLWIVAFGSLLPAVASAAVATRTFARTRTAVSLIVLLLVTVPFWGRGWAAHARTPTASRNIFEQQYQMGLFLRAFYPGGRIAANDIGAINYLVDLDNLDLAGLATLEVMRARLAGTFDTRFIDALTRARRTQIAIVYDDWYTRFGGLPATWNKLGEWTIHDNVAAGRATVAFYAVAPGEGPHLAASLRDFSARLPPSVEARGP